MPKSKTKRRNGRPRKVGRFCTMARELGAIRKSCHAKGGITLDDLRRVGKSLAQVQRLGQERPLNAWLASPAEGRQRLAGRLHQRAFRAQSLEDDR